MQSVKLMGDGYEPQVWREGDKLTYSLPVDSGFVSFDFSFVIRRNDLDVLLADDYRRAALEIIAHTLLQHSTLRGNARFTQSDFDKLLADTLHSTNDSLQVFIARINREHHIGIEHYVKAILARRAAAD
ncbi:hypothetical protein [Kosakonia sacchari]|uniref:Uncharacterized protein n=1 Tax=Kosakonia sacchari TaxID=1158459 RepID=A0A1G4YRA4_9ENTR|nr:hypothetical protein [Kosakonia sacchari]AHJ77117.1 hypothetical protein C813_22140 [Kosakonia sacchari SP1]ANR80540.1 hypothetical protein BBB57_21170 [Kosakonia sacchari]MDN2485735.1 hypothetical protein [Kosakonia sacchari]NUL37179.1 hypothetical protein [Kosakonia sacchari]SCX55944.1 hypothetical protein SAMN02927897_03222 [Kosakonia sacchari]